MTGHEPRLVIVVEDDRSMSQALERLLRVAGYTPRTFSSAELLIEDGGATRAAYLVFDVQLPGMTGFELRERLVRQGNRAPVIFITAYDEPEARNAAGKAGALAYLTKPFAGKDLIDVIRRANGAAEPVHPGGNGA
jgi:FixJ family two-component response regulator